MVSLKDPNVKKAAIAFGIFIPAVVLLMVILNLVFRRPNHHDEAKWGVVHIHMADGVHGFSQHHRQQAQEALRELNRLGPTFVLGGEGPNSIRVVNVDLTDGTPGQCPTKGAGRYVHDPVTGDHIEIDVTCTHGNPEFRSTFIHEIGHAIGMRHICRMGETSSECSSVGKGEAVMNRSLLTRADVDEGPTTDRAYTGEMPNDQITDLDIKEFERVNRPGRPLIHSARDVASPASSNLIPAPTRGQQEEALECNLTNRI